MKKLCFLLCIFSLIIKSYSQNKDYNKLLCEINNLQNDHKYLEAKCKLESVIDSFPDQWFELSKELIFINEKLEYYESNLDIFKIAHQKGYFYFIHPKMSKYKPYLSFEEFDSLSKADLNLLFEANKISKIKFEVILPQNYDSLKVYPLIFLLHGGGKNIYNVKLHWQAKILNKSYIKVYLQSYRHFDSNTYGWGTSDKKLDNELRSVYKLLIEKYSIDTNKIFIGGISAGATYAIDISIRAIIPVKGYIAYCPFIPSILKNKQFDQIKHTNCKGYIVAGEHDQFISNQIEMNQIFDSLGINYKYTILKNMGHAYPDNEEYYIKKGLRYLNL